MIKFAAITRYRKMPHYPDTEESESADDALEIDRKVICGKLLEMYVH